MVRAMKRLVHSTRTGRASSPAGDGKEEEAIATRVNHGSKLRRSLEPCQEELSFRVPLFHLRRGWILGYLALATPALAQGLPQFSPLNPMSSSRSGLYFQPLRSAAPGRWMATTSLDY